MFYLKYIILSKVFLINVTLAIIVYLCYSVLTKNVGKGFLVHNSKFQESDIVTLDGTSGAGKSTIAKALASVLSYKYLDTGATYRATTLFIIENKVNINDSNSLIKALKEINIEFDLAQSVHLNGIDVSKRIREADVVEFISEVSANKIVRENMVFLQRQIASSGCYVVDGRDIGSVVFPSAKYKFYIDASVDERARRRYLEEKEKINPLVTLDEVRESIIRRDEFDKNRIESPLVIPKDAFVIDTTNMTVDEVVNEITSVVFEIKQLKNS